MTKKLEDSDLEKLDGGIDQFTENPPDMDAKERGIHRPGPPSGGPGGGIADDLQQNPPDGGPTKGS